MKRKENEDVVGEDDEIVTHSSQQRAAEEGEPICVICGKYGEYICDQTEQDVCSLECKQTHLQHIQDQNQANEAWQNYYTQYYASYYDALRIQVLSTAQHYLTNPAFHQCNK
jgi:topoisomerase IA-like protein